MYSVLDVGAKLVKRVFRELQFPASKVCLVLVVILRMTISHSLLQQEENDLLSLMTAYCIKFDTVLSKTIDPILQTTGEP